jgi:hypothetical protein
MLRSMCEESEPEQVLRPGRAILRWLGRHFRTCLASAATPTSSISEFQAELERARTEALPPIGSFLRRLE